MNAEILFCDKAAYQAHPAISQSALKLFGQNKLLYYRTRILRAIPLKPPTPFMQIGNLVESMLRDGFEKTLGRLTVIPADVLAKNGARSTSAWRDFEEYQRAMDPDAILVTQAEYDQTAKLLLTIGRHVRDHTDAHDLLYGNHTDRSWNLRVKWTDAEFGLDRRAELDLVQGRPSGKTVIVDVKTSVTTGADWCNQAHRFGYDIQAATYREAVRALWDVDAEFFFVVIRNCEPYDVAVYELSPAWLENAANHARSLLARLSRCLAGDEPWTTHNGATIMLEQPRWAAQQYTSDDELAAELFTED